VQDPGSVPPAFKETIVAGSSGHWSDAESNADIGFPVRGGVLRRIVGKLLWPFLHRQVAVNRALLAELDAVRARLDGAEFRLDRAFGDLDHHSAVLIRHEEPLERHDMLLTRLQTNLEALQHEFEPAIVDLIRQIDVSKDMFNLGQRQTLGGFTTSSQISGSSSARCSRNSSRL
jgi:hypothetical protein